MTTWREATAAKAERQRREHRFFTPDMLGKPCPACGLRVPLLLGPVTFHPTCDPAVRVEMSRS